MKVQIARRIRKAEEAAAARDPAHRRPVKKMFYPDDACDVERFNQEVEQAVQEGFFVIRIVPLQPEART
jgi:hypothetical protein